jgi:Zincin-like metallopeptidase
MAESLVLSKMNLDVDLLLDAEAELYRLSKLELPPGNLAIRLRLSDKETYKTGGLDQGADTLGDYRKENLITLYRRNIENYARYAALEVTTVAEVVLVHEIAHSVTHLGLSEKLNGKCWDDFWCSKCSDDVEKYAEFGSWLYLTSSKSALIPTFERMQKDSPEKYRTWRQSGELTQDAYVMGLYAASKRCVDRSDLRKELEE